MKDNRRLIMILRYLHEKTDQEHYGTTVSILEYLKDNGVEVDRKTLGKDMQILAEMGFDIRKIKSSPNKYYWKEKLFKPAELQMLTDAVLSSRFISRRKSSELIKKLSSLASEYDAENIRQQINCIDRPKTDNLQVYHTINMITAAMNSRKRVSFKYMEYNQFKEKVYRNDGKAYRASPYKLYWNDDNYYLIGWDEKHDDVTVFRIDRMEEARTADSRFVEPPEDFKVEDYADKYFNMFDGEKVQVELEVRNDLMKYIIDKFGMDVETEAKTDTTFIARPIVRLSPTFYAWIFQFAGGVRVLSPTEAVKGFRELQELNFCEENC